MAEGYKKGKPDVGWWLEEVRKGLKFRKESAFEDKWSRWRQYYRNEWKADILPSAVFFKMVRSVVPRIYFRNPSISITPSMPGQENVILAKILERTDNKLIRSMKVKKQMKKIVQDAWMYGTGVGKKGFGSQFQATPEPFGVTGPVDAAALDARMKNRVEYNYDIQSNMPWFLRTHPRNFVVPDGTEDIENARWTCHLITRGVADVKDDPRLKNTKDLGPGKYTEEIAGTRKRINRLEDTIQLMEVRDKKSGMVFVISPGMVEKELLFEPDEFDNLRINSHGTVTFNEDDETFWGLPDSQILEPLALEMNEIKTYMMYHRRLSIVRILARRDGITKEEADKLIGPDVAPIVWTEGNVDEAVKIMTSAEIPQGLTTSEFSLLGEIRESLGFSRNEFGEFKEGSRSPTAFETSVVKAASEIRVDERRDMIADMLVEIVQDFHPIIFNHWTGEQVEEIVGPGGVPFWITFRPKMLSKINYNTKVDPDQSAPETKEARENKAMILYRELKQNPLIDPFRLTGYLLRELHGVQFDDMMRGVENGLGMAPNKPMNIGQFQQVLGNTARTAPQLLTGPQVTQAQQEAA